MFWCKLSVTFGVRRKVCRSAPGHRRLFAAAAIWLAAAFGLTAPAQAGWYKAESPHFVVYADDSERDVTRFAERLERFHAAMAFIMNRRDAAPPSPSNRVVIFAVGSESRVQKLLGDKSRTVAGYYMPRAGGSRAFVPTIQVGGNERDFSSIVLLHEYAHHFLISSSRFMMPRWFSEGAAEFFASAKFENDGSVGIGRPANHRAGELNYAADVTVAELLDHKLYAARKGNRYDSFYGRSWALYHYLTFDDLQDGPRKGQMRAYVAAIAGGKSETEAAAAFGDLAKLEKDLDAYTRRKRLTFIDLPPAKLPAPRITTTALSEGESAVMPLRIRSQRGVDREQALALLPEVRAVAAKYPQDAAVLTALAEAEYDAGNSEAAVAAADKAIALDHSQANAHVQKGYALFSLAEAAPADKQAAAFKAAMRPFEALNKLENDHPLPLIYFYRSFTQQGREPTELARHALERASSLAPFDQGLAFQTALMQAREGKIALAKSSLGILAANPHGGGLATTSQKLAELLAKVPEGTAWRGEPEVVAEAEAEAEAES